MTAPPTVHPMAVPNTLPVDRLRLHPDDRGAIAIDPDLAGWRFLHFRTAELSDGEALPFGRVGHEGCVVVIGGGGLALRSPDGTTVTLDGRASPFDGLPSAAYLPLGAVEVDGRSTCSEVMARPSTSAGRVQIAIAEAPRRRTTGVAASMTVIDADDVAVEIRGAGRSTRQINQILGPGFAADRLLLVEVLTPAGNWSSWPPHKHDVDDMPNEAVLEEIYHYRFRRPEAWGIQRVYRPAGGPLGPSRDGAWAVRDGDVVLVTDGYHPFAATDADDAYYLNALAGDRRTMACSFDPVLDGVRARWAGESPDPRVPLVGRDR